jgi:hypothetical protein
MEVRSEFFYGIASLIKGGSKLKKVILDGIQTGPVQNFIMERLRDALAVSKTLESLDLHSTQIANLDVALEGLLKNKSLCTLVLTSSKLTSRSVPHLAAALY